MKRRLLLIASCALAGILPFTLLARTYDVSHLPYSDAPTDRPTAVAMSVLTAEGVLQGDPGGTIRPQARLNRAEFVTIAMRLYERNLPRSTLAIRIPCFPDVPKGLWYSEKVCVAKAFGIVNGNDYPGLPPEQWPFEPTRAVQYEESLKILFRIFSLPTISVTRGQWYEEYVDGAMGLGLHLPGVAVGTQIRRGDMAQLAASFLAESEGELELLRAAQQGLSVSSASSSAGPNACQPYVCADGTTPPSCTEDGHPINYFADPCLTHGGYASSASSAPSSMSSSSKAGTGALMDQYGDTSVRSGHLLLGTVTGVLGSAKIFPDSEPVDVRKISVNLVSPASSIDALLVFNQSGALLGTATQTAVDQFVLNLGAGTMMVPQRTERSIYVRARLRSEEDGGTGGQDVQLHSFQIEGFGDWSNSKYITASTETFLAFETARARFVSIRHTGDSAAPLIAGAKQMLGQFRFETQKSDASAKPRITALTFVIESSGVTLSNAYLQPSGGSQTHACAVSGNTMACSGIDASIASLDEPLTLRLYGDVTVSATTGGFVRITLNDPGTIDAGGDITWSDGSTTFTWVPFNRPVVRGTYFSQ